MLAFVILAILGLLPVVQAAHNVTVDDNDASVQYSSGWEISSSSSLNYGGSHHLTEQRTATASFTFTGASVFAQSVFVQLYG